LQLSVSVPKAFGIHRMASAGGPSDMDGWAKIASELARGNQTPLQLLPKCQSQQLSSFVSRDLRLGQQT
jgi:hypothetical protein